MEHIKERFIFYTDTNILYITSESGKKLDLPMAIPKASYLKFN